MGTIIDPAAIKSQSDGVVRALTAQNSTLTAVLPNISNFENEPELSGAAWSGLKSHIGGHKSVIQGLICANEDVINDSEELMTASGDEKLDEDEIKAEIAELKSQNQGYSLNYSHYGNLMRQPTSAMMPTMMPYYKGMMTYYSSLSSKNNRAIAKLEKKLAKIAKIISATSSLYTTSQALYGNVETGLQQLGSSGSGGGFKGVAGGAWQTNLDKRWTSRKEINAERFLLKNGFTQDQITDMKNIGYGPGEMLAEWESLKTKEERKEMIFSVNKIFKEYGKANLKYGKELWKGFRIQTLSDGTMILPNSSGLIKRIDKLAGIEKLVGSNGKFLRLSSSGGLKSLNAAGKALFKDIRLYDGEAIFKGVSGRSWNSFKANLKASVPSVIKSVKGKSSFGFSGIFGDLKAFKSAKGIGKAVPVVNIAVGAIDVANGIDKSTKLAKKDGLKGGQVTASIAGGVVVDVGKAATVTAAATVAAGVGTAFAVSLGAPVVLVALAGIGASVGIAKGIDWIDKNAKITDTLKHGVNSLVKGAKGWFK